MTEPLLSLRGVTRDYGHGDGRVTALNGVDLDIHRGEFVVIAGQSGSGKSTLMNILGCLDWPTAGSYRVKGQAVADLSADALANLRRETFGFIFQRYHLVPSLNALENAEIPAIYAGLPLQRRHARATELLSTLGLGNRLHHRPGELSGGQQQRVSIARALMNGAEVILADEPTGALDSESGRSVVDILHQLHAQGHTIIVVTHDPDIARQGQRLVRLKDGRIIEDRAVTAADPHRLAEAPLRGESYPMSLVQESLKMAWRALVGNRMRTLLTMLGIIIGVGSVVAMLGIGAGAQARLMEQIEAFGAHLLYVVPGTRVTRAAGGDVRTLTAGDVSAIARLRGVEAAVPESNSSVIVRHGNRDAQVGAVGTGPAAPVVRNWQVARGTFFTGDHERRYAQVVVLGATTATNLFPDADPIGEYVIINNAPFLVLGVMRAKGVGDGAFRDLDDYVWLPSTTFGARVSGAQWLDIIIVRVASGQRLSTIEPRVAHVLRTRHGREDFTIHDPTGDIETANEAQRTFTLLLGSIAAISLLVGGIGVMNIMLVSVTERISEIGIRMAVGARPRDVMAQFLTEALVVCFAGGLIGITLGIAGGYALTLLGDWRMVLGPQPIVLAFACAFLTGVIFGFLPARKAASLAPVDALARE